MSQHAGVFSTTAVRVEAPPARRPSAGARPWRPVTTNSDSVRYVGEGTMSYMYSYGGCTPVIVTAPLQFEESGAPEHHGSTMLVQS
jgi:hypothetical protein